MVITIKDNKIIFEDNDTVVDSTPEEDFTINFSLPEKFSAINKVIFEDLNKPISSPFFAKYSKSKVMNFLSNPFANEKNIRNAVIYLYGVSSHFRRLIQYFAGLSDLSYVVSPWRIDTSSAQTKTYRNNYYKVLKVISAIDVKNQFRKTLTVCLREDIFFGTIRESSSVGNGSTYIQQLPSDYCKCSTIEDNVLNVSFDFSYFSRYPKYLEYYPDEFKEKYEIYKNNNSSKRWQELDAPYSFAVKCNTDILRYAVPPFAGILREIYEIEDYKDLKLSKTALENYAILVMTIGTNSNGDWNIDYNKAKEFWKNLDSVLPEEVGSILTPMPINKISFEKTNTADTDNITEAENHLFSASGVSSLLFNNTKASANALSLSIKSDQSITYGIVLSIEAVLNRYIHSKSFGRNFKITFLDCSPYNRKELGDQYIKACQYGIPMISYYCASQGLAQDEMDCMNFLENDILDLRERFVPLQSSSTQSASDSGDDNGAGRPKSDDDALSESGENTREIRD